VGGQLRRIRSATLIAHRQQSPSTLAVGFSMLLFCATARAQLTFFPSDSNIPQAQSAGELDAYGLVYESKDPGRTIVLGEKFLKDFPNSPFRAYVLVHEMYAYESQDNYEALIVTGKKALVLYPRCHDVLLMLANSIASRLPSEGSVRTKKIIEAKTYAVQDREQLETLVRSPGVPRVEFRQYMRQAIAANAGVFGLIALQGGEIDTAIVEYEKATAFSPRGVDYYRLGTAYQLHGQKEKAIGSLKHAAELGPSLISSLAEKRIRDLGGSTPQSVPTPAESSR
jgi:tetratricopeptide (TPR) repeat protein